MRDRERNEIDSFDRQNVHMIDNAADFPAGSSGAAVSALFAAGLTEVKTLAAAQVGGIDQREQQVEIKDDLLADLKAMMRRMDKAGDILEDQFPGIENLFGVPRNSSEMSVLSAARAQYDASAQYETEMKAEIGIGDFRPQLLNLINAVESASSAADLAAEQSAGSTFAFKSKMSQMRKWSRKLDKINRLKYENTPQKMGAWIMAKHIEAAPQPTPPTT